MDKIELLSPLVSVEVLGAGEGERVLVPTFWERTIFHRDFDDMKRLRRVSVSGGFVGAIEFNSLSLVHIASSKDAPAEEQTVFKEGSLAGQYMQDYSSLFVLQPAGYDGVLVDEPIRGVIPAPLISQVRFSPPLASWMYEDLFPNKYKYEFACPPHYLVQGTDFGAKVYAGNVEIVEYRDAAGALYAIPVLGNLGREIDITIAGLSGNYFLGAPIGVDVVRISSAGRFIERGQLLHAAIHNTRLGNVALGDHPATIKFPILPIDYRYDVATGEWKDQAFVGGSYCEPTLKSFIAQSPPIPIPDYGFAFVIQLNTPLDQRYHLYSLSAGARVFFGNHYILEFVPSAGGVGKARFYFFPLGYYVDQSGWMGAAPLIDPKVLSLGLSASVAGAIQEFSIRYLQPKPYATEPQHLVAPFVYVMEISEMDVWSLTKITPGATAEAFMVLPLKGHVCLFRLSDIFRAVSDGTPVKPILAFNPIEYIHRNFGNTPLGVTLMQYFTEGVIPKDSTVGVFLYNCTAYVSFCDLSWRGLTVQTKPFILAPDVQKAVELSAAPNSLIYLPFLLKGSSPLPKFYTAGAYSQLGFQFKYTEPPNLTPITVTPPSVTLKQPSNYLLFPLVFSCHREVTHEDFEPLAAGAPIAEVCLEGLHGVVTSSSPVTPASVRITIPSSKCYIVQCNTRLAEKDNNIGRVGGLVPATDLGISPSYFPDAESFYQSFKSLFAAQPSILYEVKMASGRYVPAPPLVLTADLVRAGVFNLGDYMWRNATDLSTLETELGATASIVKSVTVNLVSEPASSSAQVLLEIPYNIEPVYSPDGNLVINLPPMLRSLIRPYNLIRIKLGYTLAGEKEFISTLSPLIFEGVITGVNAVVGENELGARTLKVTVNASDMFYRANFATVDHDPPVDGWFLPEIIEYQMFNSGIFPDRLISNMWFPLGATASYLVGDTLFVGGALSYVLYSDYPFYYDIGLKTLADMPRYQVSSGSRRIDVIKQALRVAGAELTFTPYPISPAQINTFLDFVLNSLTYERFSATVKDAVSHAKLPYPSIPLGREALRAQVLPVGSYACRPTWVFQVHQIGIPSLDQIPVAPAMLNLPVILPTQPYIHGIFSLQWENIAWALPSLVNIEGERVLGQPFYFSLYDFYNEIANPNSIAFKGFRVSVHGQRNVNIVEPLQAFLAAMREYLKVGYFPPLKATLTLFGMPILGVKHIVAITPALRFLGIEDFVVTDPSGGATFWLVNTINYEWSADAPFPRMTVSLTAPHKFLAGIFGLA